jgi:hypothetical protein
MPDINLTNPFSNQPLKIVDDSLIDKDGNLFSYKWSLPVCAG